MANLLPENEQKILRAIYRARFILIGAMVFLCTAGIAAFSLLPSYLVLAAAQPPSGPTQTASEDKGTMKEIARAQSLTRELSVLFAASSSPSRLITRVLSLRPKGITVDHMVYTAASPGTLMVVGSSENRDRINEYQAALQADSFFTSVSIPVGALVGTEGNRFTVTLSGDF